MASNSNDGSISKVILIKDDGEIFLSMEYIGQIPADPPISQRLFNEPLNFGNSTSVLLSKGGSLYLSLKYLNRLLASPKNPQSAQAMVVALNLDTQRTDGAGEQRLQIVLHDVKGLPIALLNSKSVNNDQQHGVSEKQDANPVGSGQVAGQAAEQQVGMVEDQRLEQTEQGQQDEHSIQEDVLQNANSRGRTGHRQTEDAASLQESSTLRTSDQQQGGSQKSEDIVPAIPSPNKDQTNLYKNVPNPEPQGTPASQKSVVSEHGSPDAVQSALGSTAEMDNISLDGPQNVKLSGRQPRGQKAPPPIWEQLRDVRLTDVNILQSLLHGRLPTSLNAMSKAEASNEVIHLGTSADCTYSLMVSVRKHCGLGLVMLPDLQVVLRQRIRELSPRIKALVRSLDRCRAFVDNYNKLRAEQQQIENPCGINTLLDGLYSKPYETLVLMPWHWNIQISVRRYVGFFSSTNLKNKDLNDTACNALQDANDIDEQIDFCKALTRHLRYTYGHSRLVRKVTVSDEIHVSPAYPLPSYILPLGRLDCEQKVGSTSQSTIIDQLVVMDITSPRKALWRLSCSLKSDSYQMELEVLAADILDICPEQNTSDSESTAPPPILSEYPASRLRFEAGKILFEPAPKHELIEAIEQGWGASLPMEQLRDVESDGE